MHKTDNQLIKCGMLSLLCLQTEFWFITLKTQRQIAQRGLKKTKSRKCEKIQLFSSYLNE